MAVRPIGIILNGVTGRMGANQHLGRSIMAIMKQGACRFRTISLSCRVRRRHLYWRDSGDGASIVCTSRLRRQTAGFADSTRMTK